MGTLDVIFLSLGFVYLLIIVYYYFLAAASLWPKKKSGKKHPATIKFAIVIPAHNEEAVIRRTLESVKSIDYPAELFDTFVVADNCDDKTAEIVRHESVTCWERRDNINRGKGHVLKFAFERLLTDGDHTAFVVIDADTLVESGFLKAMNQRICEGAKAVQGYYDVLNPESSPMASLSYMGFVLSRNLRYKGRTRLGWTSNLLGNGMCFTREVIRAVGWSATSIVEDIEYEMILHLKGIRVAFAPEAKIYAEIPTTFSGSEVQRGRWDSGKFKVRNEYLPKLIREGIRKRDLSYFDSALELLIPPFSIFTVSAIASFCFYLLMNLDGININFYIWTTVAVGLGTYIIAGLLLARTSFKVYLSLLYAPYFLLWRMKVIISELYSKKHQKWIKTER